jgi:hypothetical protein
MAHKANIEFYLYTSFNETAADGYSAYLAMQNSGISYRHLHYGDPTQTPSVVANVQTWFPDQSVALPFVVYTQQYEDTDPQPRIPVLVSGLSEIQAADWVALVSFSG